MIWSSNHNTIERVKDVKIVISNFMKQRIRTVLVDCPREVEINI